MKEKIFGGRGSLHFSSKGEKSYFPKAKENSTRMNAHTKGWASFNTQERNSRHIPGKKKDFFHRGSPLLFVYSGKKILRNGLDPAISS